MHSFKNFTRESKHTSPTESNQSTHTSEISVNTIAINEEDIQKLIAHSLQQFEAFWTIPLEIIIQNFLAGDIKDELIFIERVKRLNDDRDLAILADYKRMIETKREQQKSVSDLEKILLFECYTKLSPELDFPYNKLPVDLVEVIASESFDPTIFNRFQCYKIALDFEREIIDRRKSNDQLQGIDKAKVIFLKNLAATHDPRLMLIYARYYLANAYIPEADALLKLSAKAGLSNAELLRLEHCVDALRIWKAILDKDSNVDKTSKTDKHPNQDRDSKDDKSTDLKPALIEKIKVMCKVISTGSRQGIYALGLLLKNNQDQFAILSDPVNLQKLYEVSIATFNGEDELMEPFEEAYYHLSLFYSEQAMAKKRNNVTLLDEDYISKLAHLFMTARHYNIEHLTKIKLHLQDFFQQFKKADPNNHAVNFYLGLLFAKYDLINPTVDPKYYFPFIKTAIAYPQQFKRLAHEQNWETVTTLPQDTEELPTQIFALNAMEKEIIGVATGFPPPLVTLTQSFFHHPSFDKAYHEHLTKESEAKAVPTP